MKFASLILGTASAFLTESELEIEVGQIIQRNNLLSQKADLQAQLESLDSSIISMAAPANATTPVNATTQPHDTSNSTNSNKSGSGCQNVWIPMVATVLILGVGGYCYYKSKKNSNSEDEQEGG